jgi:hypothetical protein
MRLVLATNVLESGLRFPGGLPSRLVKVRRCGAFDLVIASQRIEPRYAVNGPALHPPQACTTLVDQRQGAIGLDSPRHPCARAELRIASLRRRPCRGGHAAIVGAAVSKFARGHR